MRITLQPSFMEASNALLTQTGKPKRYPFSTQKHAHDIEFRRNRVKNIMFDMQSGEIPMNESEYEKLDALCDALTDLLSAASNSRDGRIVYLTGPQIGLAKETVLWAADTRGHKKY